MYSFDDIRGNDLVKKCLIRKAADINPGHAFIITGPSGTGKSLLMRAFTKMLICEKGSSCGVCHSCRAFDTDNNPDVFYIVPNANRKSIGVDIIREKLITPLYEKPYYANRKVFIIDNADILTPQAQNAFLKELEEPPSYGVFLLASDNPDKILTTIHSRAMHLSMKPLSFKTVFDYLTQTLDASEESAKRAAVFASGSIGRAINLLEDTDFAHINKIAADIILAPVPDFAHVISYSSEIEPYKSRLDELLGITLMLCRDILVYKTCGAEFIVWKEHKTAIQKAAQTHSTESLFLKQAAIVKTAEANARSVNFALNVDVLAMDAGNYSITR